MAWQRSGQLKKYIRIVFGGVVLIMFLSVIVAASRLTVHGQKDELEFVTFAPGSIGQLYRDEWRVRPAKISGKLHLPPGDGPFPAVVLMHGSFDPKDLTPWFDELVPKLVDANIAAFVVDSFTGRGISSTAEHPARLSRAALLVDAFRALSTLVPVDEIDEQRIGISGYASGGTAAMLSAHRQVIAARLAGGRSFIAHLPVYPSCQSRFSTLELSYMPILLLAGGQDEYEPPEYCLDYVKQAASAGYDVRIKVYPEAQHAWINNYKMTYCEECVTFKECGPMYIDDSGHEFALDGRVSTKFGWGEYLEEVYRDCGTRELNLAINQEARADTLATTVAFFKENLKEAPVDPDLENRQWEHYTY
jgi:dienelactone hydrolase